MSGPGTLTHLLYEQLQEKGICGCRHRGEPHEVAVSTNKYLVEFKRGTCPQPVADEYLDCRTPPMFEEVLGICNAIVVDRKAALKNVRSGACTVVHRAKAVALRKRFVDRALGMPTIRRPRRIDIVRRCRLRV